jgi:hypothetical protein
VVAPTRRTLGSSTEARRAVKPSQPCFTVRLLEFVRTLAAPPALPCPRVVIFEEEDESRFVGLLRVEAA